MKEVRILSTGRYVPEKILDNDFLSHIVDTNDEWITTRTGIKERRISTGENTSDLAVKAAQDALRKVNMKPEQIELIIVATVTPDNFTPSVSCIVQEKIGAKSAACFDINAACSGYLYSIDIASSMIKGGRYKNALIIGVEVLSKVVNWKDRNTCVLFGDGAGAAILSISEEKGIYSSFIASDGSKGNLLKIPALQVNNIVATVEKEESFIYMDGKEVFKFATEVIVNSIQRVLDESNLNIEDIKLIVPHQANIRIIEFAAKKLKLRTDKFYINIERFGNTSAASIGIALDEAIEKGLLNKGDNVILVGFGGGLTWGASLIKI
ncbi:3-oxoacyl-[acyl-carrier-protein] synthase 3 [Caloramator mitchellensis]|uniref:Beta-ketoacyl-[acyl-carrier-protein] synthase III n=1 Tax=Caloramator mitchellensis TaxID=908809 RepID=A0A0R3JWG1_CALMK|nr:beta-ketoacyl-ACP synthase III [Caloramator mitchellensis]KRQ87864.1 3-oxoacyl-[acyl-carrier-protein] synthase 3 [Caloramator mitchellensis]